MTHKTETIAEICREDDKYNWQAYNFTLDAISFTVQKLKKHSRVRAQELLDGIREYATQQFGGLGYTVFEEWGITEWNDFGNIVDNLMKNGLVSRTGKDSLDDFVRKSDLETDLQSEYGEWLSRVSMYKKQYVSPSIIPDVA